MRVDGSYSSITSGQLEDDHSLNEGRHYPSPQIPVCEFSDFLKSWQIKGMEPASVVIRPCVCSQTIAALYHFLVEAHMDKYRGQDIYLHSLCLKRILIHKISH